MSDLSILSGLDIPHKKRAFEELRTLQENLTRCYNEQLFVDAEIRIQNRTFKAHKSILAFYSPLFQKAFYGIKIPSSLYIINDLNPEGFDILLRFLYTSEIPDQASSDNLADACLAAQLLEMTGIKEKLIQYILYKTEAKKLRKPIVEKFWSLLQKSHSLKLKELEERLLKFAENHMETVLNHDDFVKADTQLIKLVLDKTTLAVSESHKLERIAHWKDSNSELESLELSVRDLLAYVHFERLTPKEFYIIVSKHYNLISEYDAVDILMHLVDPTASSLPEWCSIRDKQNIPIDISMNKETLNLEEWQKTDKFKSLEDLCKIGNSNSINERRKLTAFQSQKDLRKLEDFKTLEVEKEMKFNLEAESSSKTLPQSFYQMLKEGLFTDVTLYAKDESKIPAHRLIFALGSEVFAKMLYGATPSNTLRLEETADELKTILRYFYGTGENISKINVLTHLDSILRKLDIALKYNCYPLIRNCCNALDSTSMTPYAFWKLLDQKNKLENCSVVRPLLRYARNSPKKVFDHEGFYSASINSLVPILKSCMINMPESDILEYIARWLERNVSTDNSRKELFKHVRFEALNAEQFFAFVRLHDDLLPKEDAFAILTFLFRESKENRLPEWCYCGPLRGFFYDQFSKIGTDVLIPWKNTYEKGKKLFRCAYIAAIAEGIKESQVQYLELSWRVDPLEKRHKNYNWNITVKHDGSEPLKFNITQKRTTYHRIIVPVFFTLNTQIPKIQFYIEVKSETYHRYCFIQGKKMTFDNVVIEAKSDINCVSDAIVDNSTSEHIKIPKYLLPRNSDSDAAVPTKKCFKVSEDVRCTV